MQQLEADLNFISSLPARPAMTTQALQQEFDKAGNTIKDFINNIMIGEITSTIADAVATMKEYTDGKIGELSFTASNISYDNTLSGLTATNVQNAVDEVKTTLEGDMQTLQSTLNTSIAGKTTYSDFALTEYSFDISVHGGNTSWQEATQNKSGYYPIAVACQKCTGIGTSVNYEGAFLGVYITSQSSGQVKYQVGIKGTSQESATFGIKGVVKILWVKVK